jgi:hypothetical protein
MSAIFEALGGRKFVAATLTVAVGILVSLKMGDIPPGLLSLLEFAFGGYALSNSINTVTGIIADRKVQLDSTAVEAAPVQSGIPVTDAVVAFNGLTQSVGTSHAEIKADLDMIKKSVELSQKVLTALTDRLVK